MDEYQVIIVGSGPAGSACARALKDEGIEVLVVEKKQLPRYKTCTGILLGQAQMLVKEYFGELPPNEVLCEPRIIKASDVLEWDKERGFSTFVWEIPKDGQSFPQDYLNIWRNKFDYWLLEKAGVEYMENCEFRDFSVLDNKVKVRFSGRDEENKDLYCSYLIGADGGSSRVRTGLDPSWAKGSDTVGIYQAYFRLLDMGSLKDSDCYVFLEREFGDILTVVHRKDEFLMLSLGGFKGRSLKKSMEALKDFLAEKFHVVLGDMERDEGCVSRPPLPYLGNDRVLLAGDAAGLMYLNGEGMGPAIDSGYKAGKAAAQGIKQGKNVLETYENDMKGILKHMKLCFGQQHMFAAK